MTPGRFRLLLVAHLLSILASALLSIRDEGLSPALVEAYETATPAWVENETAAFVAFMVLGTAIYLAAYAGVWFFRPWGRALMLWSTVAGLLLYPFFGPIVAGPWSSALYDTSMLSLGALLACAYCSPVRERFEARSPQSPRPNP